MGRQVDWDEIPDSNIFPEGIYLAVGDAMEERMTQEAGKLMFVPTFIIEEPKEYAGLKISDYFVIGSNDDPEAELAPTWKSSIGGKNMKRMIKGLQIPLTPDTDEIGANMVGSKVLLRIDQQVDDGKKNPDYKGTIRNRIRGYYEVGSKEIHIVEDEAPSPAPKAATKRATKKVAQVTTSPVAEAASKPALAEPKKKVAKKTKLNVLLCSICDEQVERSEFAAHVAGHEDEE